MTGMHGRHGGHGHGNCGCGGGCGCGHHGRGHWHDEEDWRESSLREKKEDLEEYRRKLEEELADVSTRISRLS